MLLTNYDLLCQNQTISLFVVVLVKPSIVESSPYLFYGIFTFEVLNLFISCCLFLPMVLILNKFHLYHINIIRITQIFIGSYYIVIIVRLITIAYEMRLFELKGTLPEDYIVLIASICRIGFTAQYGCMVPALLAERAFATYYLEDYEQKRRAWIIGIVYAMALLNAIITASMLTNGEVSFPHMAIFLSMITAGLICFAIFYHYNRRRLSDLSDTYQSSTRYTLSTRYQVTENLKVMKKILLITVIMFLFMFVVAILAILSFLVYGFFSFMGQLCMALLELWIAFSANAITAFLFFMSKKWINTTVRDLFSSGELPTKVQMVNRQKDTTDVYFALFAKQW